MHSIPPNLGYLDKTLVRLSYAPNLKTMCYGYYRALIGSPTLEVKHIGQR